MNVSSGAALALAVILGGAAGVSAQTAAPATSGGAAEDRANFSGTWKLDRDLSNDPALVNFDPQQQNAQPARARGGFGGFGGFGAPGRGGTRSGGRDNRVASATPDERARLAALTEQLKKASATLIVSHHDPSFVINDAEDHTLFLQTDASRIDNMLGTVTLASTTHWAGDRIVTEYTLSSRRTLVYTYTLLAGTKQMVLRVRAEFTDMRGSLPELKLVYTLAP